MSYCGLSARFDLLNFVFPLRCWPTNSKWSLSRCWRKVSQRMRRAQREKQKCFTRAVWIFVRQRHFNINRVTRIHIYMLEQRWFYVRRTNSKKRWHFAAGGAWATGWLAGHQGRLGATAIQRWGSAGAPSGRVRWTSADGYVRGRRWQEFVGKYFAG